MEDSWQPQDYLPDASQEDWLDRIKDIKEMNADMPDEVRLLEQRLQRRVPLKLAGE